MRKHLIIGLAIAGLAFSTACGQKAAYKAIKAQKTDPKKNNPVAPEGLSVQAVKMINADTRHAGRDSVLSSELKDSLQGVTAKFTSSSNAANIQIALLSKEEKNCSPRIIKKDNITLAALKDFVSIENTRIKCFTAACDSAVLIIEKGDSSGTGAGKYGSVAVLLAKQNDVLVPNTAIELFININNVNTSVEDCKRQQEVTDQLDAKQKAEVEVAEIDAQLTSLAAEVKAQNGVANDEQKERRRTLLERRAALIEKNKLEVGAAPASNEASAEEQNLTAEQQQAKAAAVARIAAIDTEIVDINAKLAAGETKDAEGNDLGTKRSTLLAERGTIIQEHKLEAAAAPEQTTVAAPTAPNTTVAPVTGTPIDPGQTTEDERETPERD